VLLLVDAVAGTIVASCRGVVWAVEAMVVASAKAEATGCILADTASLGLAEVEHWLGLVLEFVEPSGGVGVWRGVGRHI